MAIPGVTTSEDVYVTLDTIENGSMILTIPFPYKKFNDTPFFLMDVTNEEKLLIPDRCYKRITGDTLLIEDPESIGLTIDSLVKFIFVHAQNKFHINKLEDHIRVMDYQSLSFRTVNALKATVYEYNLTLSPYFYMYNLNNRFQVYHKRKAIIAKIYNRCNQT